MQDKPRRHVFGESIGGGILMTNPNLPDNPIVFASKSFLKLTGYTLDEVVGQNCRFLQGPETDPCTVANIKNCLQNQRGFVGEILNYRKNGEPFWNLLRIEPTFDENQKLQYFIGVQNDLTTLQLGLKKLQNIHINTNARNNFQLISSLCYELNQPVNALQHYLHQCLLLSAPGTELYSTLQKAIQQFQRASTIMHMHKDALKLPNGHLDLHNINQIIRDLLPVFYLFDQDLEKQIECHFAEPECLCYVNSAQIEQLIYNILQNAIDAVSNLPPTQRHIEIHTQHNTDNHVLLKVIDNGKGIKTEQIKHIYEPFYTSKSKRSGIGLAIAKSIVMNHDGEISYSWDPQNKTSEFKILLPDKFDEVGSSQSKAA